MSCENCNTDKCNCDKSEEQIQMVYIKPYSNVKIKKLNKNAQLPTRGSAAAAGYDLYAVIDSSITINPHETVLIGTGLAFELPDGTFGALYPRSGIASKRGLRPANCIGVVDSDYRGEVKVALHNDTDDIQEVEAGERIAQIILHSYIPMIFEEVDDLDSTERGTGSFGSTGIK